MDLLQNPSESMIFLGALSMLPFIIMMGTAFIKISVVLALLRNALGIQQIPPNMAMHGIALAMTLFIMAPVGLESFQLMQEQQITLTEPHALKLIFEVVLEPYRAFLLSHTAPADLERFQEVARTLWADKYHIDIHQDNLVILLPAFVTTQLMEAFEIGFLIYLPMLIIDLVVSNILLAMGMMMVSPMTISLPFKLLLFVMLDGWSRVINALMMSYY